MRGAHAPLSSLLALRRRRGVQQEHQRLWLLRCCGWGRRRGDRRRSAAADACGGSRYRRQRGHHRRFLLIVALPAAAAISKRRHASVSCRYPALLRRLLPLGRRCGALGMPPRGKVEESAGDCYHRVALGGHRHPAGPGSSRQAGRQAP